MNLLRSPLGDRPREKLLLRGPEALTDAELLAVALRTGDAQRSGLELGHALLQRFHSLTASFAASSDAVCVEPGLGPARYASLRAGFELARRTLREEAETRAASQLCRDDPGAQPPVGHR